MATQTQYPNIWGIYTDVGAPVFDVDTVNAVKYENATRVSNFPVEQGAFASYNKVQSPYKARVRFSLGGSSQRIEALLTKLEQVVDDLNLYHVVTPEKTYLNANLERFGYSREEKNGQNMVIVELDLLEIRQVTPQYATVPLPASRVKKSSSASKVDNGKNQGQDAAGSQKSLGDLTYAEIQERARRDANAANGVS